MKAFLFFKCTLIGFLIISGGGLLAAPQIHCGEIEAKIAFASQADLARRIPLNEEDTRPYATEAFEENDIPVPVGQPLPGIELTLLIGAACYLLRKCRRREKRCEHGNVAVGRKSIPWNTSANILRKYTYESYGAYWRQPIVLRL